MNLTPTLHYATRLDGDSSRAVVSVDLLADRLPHGSGIDGDWHITVRRNGDLSLYADYHMMNDGGYYCGWRTLRASIVKCRREELHMLNTPGFAQILHQPGDIILKTHHNGDAGDYFHDVLDSALGDLITRGGHASIEVSTRKPAVYSREMGGWVVAELVD